jgi:hypothetical protein
VTKSIAKHSFFVDQHTMDPNFRMLDCCKLANLRGPSKRRFFPSPSISNLVFYLCAKFGALNLRINEIGSQTIGLDPFLKCALHCIIICEEIAYECLLCARTAPMHSLESLPFRRVQGAVIDCKTRILISHSPGFEG